MCFSCNLKKELNDIKYKIKKKKNYVYNFYEQNLFSLTVCPFYTSDFTLTHLCTLVFCPLDLINVSIWTNKVK